MIAVVGSGKDLTQEESILAESLGAAIVKEGWGIVTGGLGGVMEAVSRGAVRQRGKALHPPIVGILPSYDVTTGNAYIDVALPTGLSHGRNVLVAAAGEVVVCVAGATGALSEVAAARKIGRPVIAFGDSGGTASLVAKALPAVIPVRSVQEAIREIKELIPS